MCYFFPSYFLLSLEFCKWTKKIWSFEFFFLLKINDKNHTSKSSSSSSLWMSILIVKENESIDRSIDGWIFGKYNQEEEEKRKYRNTTHIHTSLIWFFRFLYFLGNFFPLMSHTIHSISISFNLNYGLAKKKKRFSNENKYQSHSMMMTFFICFRWAVCVLIILYIFIISSEIFQFGLSLSFSLHIYFFFVDSVRFSFLSCFFFWSRRREEKKT